MKNENEKLFNENKNAEKSSGNFEIEELPEENADNKSKKVGKVLFELLEG